MVNACAIAANRKPAGGITAAFPRFVKKIRIIEMNFNCAENWFLTYYLGNNLKNSGYRREHAIFPVVILNPTIIWFINPGLGSNLCKHETRTEPCHQTGWHALTQTVTETGPPPLPSWFISNRMNSIGQRESTCIISWLADFGVRSIRLG